VSLQVELQKNRGLQVVSLEHAVQAHDRNRHGFRVAWLARRLQHRRRERIWRSVKGGRSVDWTKRDLMNRHVRTVAKIFSELARHIWQRFERDDPCLREELSRRPCKLAFVRAAVDDGLI